MRQCQGLEKTESLSETSCFYIFLPRSRPQPQHCTADSPFANSLDRYVSGLAR
jgi:hypothetical protein